MAVRVGPPWLRRLVALCSLFVPLVALSMVPASAPDAVSIALAVGVFALPMVLLRVFGVTVVAG